MITAAYLLYFLAGSRILILAIESAIEYVQEI
jgi:hypothetical protein